MELQSAMEAFERANSADYAHFEACNNARLCIWTTLPQQSIYYADIAYLHRYR
jgi:hypothetical protein